MTQVTFFDGGERITGFCCSGHSGYGPVGEDIVCAAVSAAVSVAANTITDVLGIRAKVRVDEENVRVTLTLPASCEPDQEQAAQAVLTGMMLTLTGWRDDYPAYLEVIMD